MTVDEIIHAAVRSEPLPDDLSQPRQLLFLSLRILYRNFKAGAISKEQARLEKIKILNTYKSSELTWLTYSETAQMRNRLSHYLTQIEKNGCPMCQMAVRIFDGRAK